MPIAVRQAPRPRPGCWYRLASEDGRPSNWIGYTCPLCDTLTLTGVNLDEGYQIARDCTVSPDFVCTNADCDYTAPLRLKGWTEPSVSIPSIPEPAQDQP